MITYKNLQPGMVIGTTKLWGFLGASIRATTAGISNTFNDHIASHIVIVCENHGLLYGMEMNWPIIRRVDLNDYTKKGHRIVFVGKHPTFDAMADLSEKANEFLWRTHELRVKYGTLEVFEFWGFKTDQPGRLICSELYVYMLRYLGITYPSEWDYKVSPYDIQKYWQNNFPAKYYKEVL